MFRRRDNLAFYVPGFYLLEYKGNYSATSDNMNLQQWPLLVGLLHLVQRERDLTGPQSAQALLTVPYVTAHPLMASVPIIVLLHNGPLLYGFNVLIEGLHLSKLLCNSQSKAYSCLKVKTQ